jgi:butyrate kinase
LEEWLLLRRLAIAPESEEEEGRCEPETSESLKTERLVAIAFSEVKLSAEREKMERSGGMRRKEGTDQGYYLASRGGEGEKRVQIKCHVISTPPDRSKISGAMNENLRVFSIWCLSPGMWM